MNKKKLSVVKLNNARKKKNVEESSASRKSFRGRWKRKRLKDNARKRPKLRGEWKKRPEEQLKKQKDLKSKLKLHLSNLCVMEWMKKKSLPPMNLSLCINVSTRTKTPASSFNKRVTCLKKMLKRSRSKRSLKVKDLESR